MSPFLEKIFSLKKGDIARAFPFFLLLMLFSAGGAFSRNIGMSMVVTDYGKDALPLFFALIAIFQLGGSMIYANLSNRFNAPSLYVKLLIVQAIFALVCFGLMTLKIKMASALLYVGVFVLSPVIAMHDSTHLANYFNTVEQKRITGFVYAGICLGAMAGGAMLIALLKIFPPAQLLTMSFAFALGTAVLVKWIAKSQTSMADEGSLLKPKKNPLAEMADGVKESTKHPLVVWMAIGVFLGTLLQQFMVYLYQGVIYPDTFQHPADRTAFFGKYDVALNFLALIFQLFAASKIIQRLGVGMASIVHPVLYLLASVGLAGHLGFPQGVMSQAINQEARTYFRKPVENLLFNGLPGQLWGTSKAFLSGVVQPVAILLSTGFLIAVKVQFGQYGPIGILPLLCVLISILGVLCVFPQLRAYNKGVVDMLKTRSLPKGMVGQLSPQVLAQQANILIDSQNDTEILMALELIRQCNDASFVPKIIDILEHSESMAILESCMDTLSRLKGDQAIQALEKAFDRFLGEPVNLAMLKVALRNLKEFDSPELASKVSTLISGHSAKPELFMESVLFLHQSNHFMGKSLLLERASFELLESETTRQINGLEVLGRLGTSANTGDIRPFLNSEEKDCRVAAVRAMRQIHTTDPDSVKDDLLPLLRDRHPGVRYEVLLWMTMFNPPIEIFQIAHALDDHSPKVCALAKKFLSENVEICRDDLRKFLFLPETPLSLRQEILNLIKPETDEVLRERLEKETLREIQSILLIKGLSADMKKGAEDDLMKEFLARLLDQMGRERVAFAIASVVSLASQEQEMAHRLMHGFNSPRKVDQGNALEALSQLKVKGISGPLQEILEEMPTTFEAANELHRRLFSGPLPDLMEDHLDNLPGIHHVYLKAAAWQTRIDKNPELIEEIKSKAPELLKLF